MPLHLRTQKHVGGKLLFVPIWLLFTCRHSTATGQVSKTGRGIFCNIGDHFIVEPKYHCTPLRKLQKESLKYVSLCPCQIVSGVMQGATSLQMHSDPSHLVAPQL